MTEQRKLRDGWTEYAAAMTNWDAWTIDQAGFLRLRAKCDCYEPAEPQNPPKPEVPPAGCEYVGECRPPVIGETYLSYSGNYVVVFAEPLDVPDPSDFGGRRHILRPAKPKLENCRFCGGIPRMDPTAVVHCTACGASGPWYDRDGVKWNSAKRTAK